MICAVQREVKSESSVSGSAFIRSTWFPALWRNSAGVLRRCRLNSETCRHVNSLSASVLARSTLDLCASRLLAILSNFRSFGIPWPLCVLWSRRESAICVWRIAGKRLLSCYPLNVPRLFVSILGGSAPKMDSRPGLFRKLMNCQPCSRLPVLESGLRLFPSLHAGPGPEEFECIQFRIRRRFGPSEPLGGKVKRVYW